MNRYRFIPKSLKLSTLEEAVMLTMQDKARYGLQIIDMVHHASNGYEDIHLGSLYPLLRRLTQKGLINATQVAEATEIRGGHRRKYYELTPLGKTALFEAEQLRHNLRSWQDSDLPTCAQPST